LLLRFVIVITMNAADMASDPTPEEERAAREREGGSLFTAPLTS
jgi:hypothetical protein